MIASFERENSQESANLSYSWLLGAKLIGMKWATPCGDMLGNFLWWDRAFMSTGRHPREVSSLLHRLL